MATTPEQRRPVLLVVAIAIGLTVIALIAALVWRPLSSSLRLGPAPLPASAGHAPAAAIRPVSAAAARAP